MRSLFAMDLSRCSHTIQSHAQRDLLSVWLPAPCTWRDMAAWDRKPCPSPSTGPYMTWTGNTCVSHADRFPVSALTATHLPALTARGRQLTVAAQRVHIMSWSRVPCQMQDPLIAISSYLSLMHQQQVPCQLSTVFDYRRQVQ